MKRSAIDLTVEVKVFKKEQLLNLLLNNNIIIKNSRTVDRFTIRFDVNYSDYKYVRKLVKRLKGKIKIVNKSIFLKILMGLRNNIGLPIGIISGFIVLLILSNFVLRISIEGKSYLAPYEVRSELKKMGIKPGMLKSSIDVSKIEKDLEKNLEEIMWINARVEGGTLKIKYEEKILTSVKSKNEELIGTEKVAIMDGKIKRVYATSGVAKVKEGDIVKKGDILIVGEQGEDETVKEKVVPEGVVLADTFYEKNIELKVSGEEEVYTKNKDEEIYISVYGKKIYLKKPTKEFENYDKIEEKGKILNKNIYYEKKREKIIESKDSIIKEAISKLEHSVTKEISRDSIIIDKIITEEEIEDGKINLKVLFVVEQNIVSS
ncbi:sporulation protein YqfD [Clostridium massiliamazoniense]|uniref:sporulation protein YqfD n=1 Tax=Clostridium massiliamazoniense TaxID=1347366 RepID=UPI0006D7CF66|nr:sporulation protein YqfD [Clostridium massiliamazoniense]